MSCLPLRPPAHRTRGGRARGRYPIEHPCFQSTRGARMIAPSSPGTSIAVVKIWRLRADGSAGVPARRSIHCEPSRGQARRTATGSGFGRARRNGPTSRHRARHMRVPRSGHARSALVDWRAAFRRTRHAQPAGARCRRDRRQRAPDGTGGHGSRDRPRGHSSVPCACSNASPRTTSSSHQGFWHARTATRSCRSAEVGRT